MRGAELIRWSTSNTSKKFGSTSVNFHYLLRYVAAMRTMGTMDYYNSTVSNIRDGWNIRKLLERDKRGLNIRVGVKVGHTKWETWSEYKIR